MARKEVFVSDISGKEIDEGNVARVVVSDHPALGSRTVELDAAVDEVQSWESSQINLVSIGIQLPGQSGVRRVVEPVTIVLFGSYARGEATASSDLDILVVTDESFGPHHGRREELGRLYRALADIPTPKDILLYGRDEVERWRAATNHLVAAALREGEVL